MIDDSQEAMLWTPGNNCLSHHRHNTEQPRDAQTVEFRSSGTVFM